MEWCLTYSDEAVNIKLDNYFASVKPYLPISLPIHPPSPHIIYVGTSSYIIDAKYPIHPPNPNSLTYGESYLLFEDPYGAAPNECIAFGGNSDDGQDNTVKGWYEAAKDLYNYEKTFLPTGWRMLGFSFDYKQVSNHYYHRAYIWRGKPVVVTYDVFSNPPSF